MTLKNGNRSRRVRIKLLAPGFPKRVLKTVKWLGDVYDMPIEAIEVKLFEDVSGAYHLTVERLLPVRGDDAFDLTVREREAQKQSTNVIDDLPSWPRYLHTVIFGTGSACISCDALYSRRNRKCSMLGVLCSKWCWTPRAKACGSAGGPATRIRSNCCRRLPPGTR